MTGETESIALDKLVSEAEAHLTELAAIDGFQAVLATAQEAARITGQNRCASARLKDLLTVAWMVAMAASSPGF